MPGTGDLPNCRQLENHQPDRHRACGLESCTCISAEWHPDRSGMVADLSACLRVFRRVQCKTGKIAGGLVRIYWAYPYLCTRSCDSRSHSFGRRSGAGKIAYLSHIRSHFHGCISVALATRRGVLSIADTDQRPFAQFFNDTNPDLCKKFA